MVNQPPAAQNSEKAETATPPTSRTEALNTDAAEPATAEQLANVEEKMTGFERATLRWAKVAVLMSGLAAIFVSAQWYEMHTGARDTHDLAIAAKAQAEKAETISDSIQRAVTAMETGNRQAKEGIDRTLAQSKSALDASLTTSRLDQRAWVGWKYIHVDALEVGKTVVVDVALVNSGKTLARTVKGYSVLALAPTMELSEFLEPPPEPSQTIGPFWPELVYTVSASGTATSNGHQFSLVKTGLDAINSRALFLFVYGKYTYKDVFNWPHLTTFCARYSPASKKFEGCEKYNFAD